jgi:hypothetical protein
MRVRFQFTPQDPSVRGGMALQEFLKKLRFKCERNASSSRVGQVVGDCEHGNGICVPQIAVGP